MAVIRVRLSPWLRRTDLVSRTPRGARPRVRARFRVIWIRYSSKNTMSSAARRPSSPAKRSVARVGVPWRSRRRSATFFERQPLPADDAAVSRHDDRPPVLRREAVPMFGYGRIGTRDHLVDEGGHVIPEQLTGPPGDRLGRERFAAAKLSLPATGERALIPRTRLISASLRPASRAWGSRSRSHPAYPSRSTLLPVAVGTNFLQHRFRILLISPDGYWIVTLSVIDIP